MNKLFALLSIFFLFLVACSQGQETTVRESTQDIQEPVGKEVAEESMEAPVVDGVTAVVIQGFAYSPVELKVKKGTTVTWTNQDSVRHNVAFDSGDVKGPLLAKGESYSFTFDEVETFAYHCTPHPNMKARVIVE